MRNHSIFTRCAVAVLATLAFCSVMAGGLHAQSTVEKCNCDVIKVQVADDVACKITVVFLYPSQPFNPGVVVAPGTVEYLPCEEGTEITVVDCLNHKNLLGPDGCLHNFPAGDDCCVEACLIEDADGCLLLDIRRSPERCVCE